MKRSTFSFLPPETDFMFIGESGKWTPEVDSSSDATDSLVYSFSSCVVLCALYQSIY